MFNLIIFVFTSNRLLYIHIAECMNEYLYIFFYLLIIDFVYKGMPKFARKYLSQKGSLSTLQSKE